MGAMVGTFMERDSHRLREARVMTRWGNDVAWGGGFNGQRGKGASLWAEGGRASELKERQVFKISIQDLT